MVVSSHFEAEVFSIYFRTVHGGGSSGGTTASAEIITKTQVLDIHKLLRLLKVTITLVIKELLAVV
jgi:hypothetical protein